MSFSASSWLGELAGVLGRAWSHTWGSGLAFPFHKRARETQSQCGGKGLILRPFSTSYVQQESPAQPTRALLVCSTHFRNSCTLWLELS